MERDEMRITKYFGGALFGGAVCLLTVSGLIPVWAEEVAATKEEPRLIGWSDLKVKVTKEDPLKALSHEQIEQLGMILRVRKLREDGLREPSAYMADKAKEYLESFHKQSIDVDTLMKRVAEYRALREGSATALVEGLADSRVRLPGFAVPLEYDGKRVIEFLLVPWAGACIHTPPPPVNQIVHVKMKKGFELSSIDASILVSGKVTRVKKEMKSLYIVDGAMDITFGYNMEAEQVEKYVQVYTGKESSDGFTGGVAPGAHKKE